MMAHNYWLAILGAAAAAAAVTAAAVLTRRASHGRVAHLFHDRPARSWENEGGSLAATAK